MERQRETSQLPWVSRNVEPLIEKWLRRPSSIVLIRGSRRVGKSSTVKQCCRRLNIPMVELCISPDEGKFVDDVSNSFNLCGSNRPNTTTRAAMTLVDQLLTGKVIILEEIQNASPCVQVALQQAIDQVGFEASVDPFKWAKSGVLFLMGSLPSEVDDMMFSRHRVLYQRVLTTIDIFPFNTHELCTLMDQHNISPQTALKFEALFAGSPFGYSCCYSDGLLRDDVQDEKLIKAFFASDLQFRTNDAKSFGVALIGERLGIALDAALKEKTRKKQIESVATQLQISSDQAWNIVDGTLYHRYGLLAPVYDPRNKKSIIKFVLSYQMLIATKLLRPTISADDGHNLRLNHDAVSRFQNLQGEYLEDWVRRIIQNRYLLLNEKALPLKELANGTVCIEKWLSWSNEKKEIDQLVSQPLTKVLVVGSVMRSVSKHSHYKLQQQWDNLHSQNSQRLPPALDERLCKKTFDQDWKVVLVHISTTRETTEVMVEGNNDTYILSIEELLEPFMKQLKASRATADPYLQSPQAVAPSTTHHEAKGTLSVTLVATSSDASHSPECRFDRAFRWVPHILLALFIVMIATLQK